MHDVSAGLLQPFSRRQDINIAEAGRVGVNVWIRVHEAETESDTDT